MEQRENERNDTTGRRGKREKTHSWKETRKTRLRPLGRGILIRSSHLFFFFFFPFTRARILPSFRLISRRSLGVREITLHLLAYIRPSVSHASHVRVNERS